MSLLEELILESAHTINRQAIINKSETCMEYLHQLSSLQLHQLKQQPSQLHSKAVALQSELCLLCFRQFKNLLQHHHSSIQINHSLNNLFRNLNQFIHTTHQLDHLSTNSLPNKKLSHLNTIIHDRNQIKLILNHLPSFESLLELPQLISTCINNPHQHLLWNQTIDMAIQIHHLNQKLIPNHQTNQNNTSFINLIQIQVDRTLQSLRDHLLNRLSDSNLKLPLAVRTISTLRRLSSTLSSNHLVQTTHHHHHHHHHHPFFIHFQPILPVELGLSFLISRWKALTENLNQLQLSSALPISSINSPTLNLSQNPLDPFNDHLSQPNDDRFKFLRRWIEIWREFVGDALSIYSDIFLSTSSTSLHLQHLTPSSKYSSSKHFLNDPQTPLNFFLTQALNLLNSVLSDHLNSVTSVSSLASLLTQLAYCGTAFGKSGFDFTNRIFPLLLDRLEQLIKLRIQSGLQQLQNDLRPILSPSPTAHAFKRSAGFQIRRRSLNPFSSNSSTFIGLENCLISTDSIHQVLKLKPEQLQGSESQTSMRLWLSFFPLLARFVNSHFTALNELRLLPAAESYAAISEAQFESFQVATEYLTKIVLVLPTCPPASGSSHGLLQEPNFEDEMSEDQEKRSETRFRLVLYRLVLVWTRCVLPILERSLRVGIYQDLSIESAESRFIDLLNQCEALLSLIIPPPIKAEENDGNPEILKAQPLCDEKVSEPIDDQKSQVCQKAKTPSIDDQIKKLEESRQVDRKHSSELDISNDVLNLVDSKKDKTTQPEEDSSNLSAPRMNLQLESNNKNGGSNNEDGGSKNENDSTKNEDVSIKHQEDGGNNEDVDSKSEDVGDKNEEGSKNDGDN